MPSPVAARLSERHRLAQRRIGVLTVARMRRVWPLLSIEDLDGSFLAWLSTVEPIVTAGRAESSSLAAAYVTAYRTLELGPDASFVARRADPLDPARLRRSMLVTGPINIKSKIGRGVDRTLAMSQSEAGASGAAMRHVVNGGRETVLASVAEDRQARGWRRMTSGNACDFCSMLASRADVYSESTSQFAAHDSCLCSAVPVYRD